MWAGYPKPVKTIRQSLLYSKDPLAIEYKYGEVYEKQCRDCERISLDRRQDLLGLRSRNTTALRRPSLAAVGTLDIPSIVHSSDIVIGEEDHDLGLRIRETNEILCLYRAFAFHIFFFFCLI